MITVYFGKVGKKKNSTYRPTLTDSFSVTLKDGCSKEHPTFLLNHTGEFEYNYCIWGDHYYFVTDVTYTRNNLVTIECAVDVLATYKPEILTSTQYVSYSSVSGGTWLPDTRIPVLKSTVVSKATANLGIFYDPGHYIMSVIGLNGCEMYACSKSQISALIGSISDHFDNVKDLIKSDIVGFEDVPAAIESLSTILTNTDVLGNAYSNAPSCIRSCIWVPFSIGGEVPEKMIYLGQYPTGVSAEVVDGFPRTGSVSVNIPWHFTDWRRSLYEDIYLYHPLVGMISLAADSLTQASSITINYSYTLSDGAIAYQIISGNEIIGSYGGSCAANYPIGINQQASAGEIINTMVGGLQKVASDSLVFTGADAMVADTFVAAYQTASTQFTTHPSCIGGVGGGAGAGLDLKITCYTVAHNTVIEPSVMAATMGVPTMKPVQLSECSGYCQCVNAHVAAEAHGDELDKIDTYINSGFYIE